MQNQLNFDDKSTKELLSKYDMAYFFEENTSRNKYDPTNVKLVELSYKHHEQLLKTKIVNNKTQAYYLLDSYVRQMFTGGLLPSMFGLNDLSQIEIILFDDFGENWAHFDAWQKLYKQKNRSEKIWNIIVKTGTVLAFLLSFIKLYEAFNQ